MHAYLSRRLKGIVKNNLEFVVLCLCCLTSDGVVAQEFACDGSIYFVTTSNAKGSSLYRMYKDASSGNLTYEPLPLHNDQQRHITCLGYNVKDMKIYGLDFNTYELLRLHANGEIESLGIPMDLDTSFYFYAGEMTADGRRLMLVAQNKTTRQDERMYSVQVNTPPDYLAGYFPVIADRPVRSGDLAIDPIVGSVYGFDDLGGTLTITERSGFTSTSHLPYKTIDQDIGALAFDQSGNLFAIAGGKNGNSLSNFLSITKTTGEGRQIGGVPDGFDADACGCPYTIEFQKTITPPEIIGCNYIDIQYKVINKAGIGQVGINLVDDLPQPFRITDIDLENEFLVNISSGAEDNRLDIDEWTLLLGENIVDVRAYITTSDPQTISSQAELAGLPRATESFNKSDDPSTPMIRDPTSLKIMGIEPIALEDHSRVSCNLDTTFLSLPLEGRYLWSTGDTQTLLPVIGTGLYAVTVENSCYTYYDSITITEDREPLRIDAGSVLYHEIGDLVTLSIASNAGVISSIEWSSPQMLDWDCSQCLSPQFEASIPAVITVRVIDQYRCTATDTVVLQVDQTKKLYVPTAFTPNHDGINDVLTIQGKTGFVRSFRVVDRWGNLIYEVGGFTVNGQTEIWNGQTSKGTASPGVYLWFSEIDFPDHSSEIISGEVTILQ